ncbi:hypothetical protein LTR27_005630 [Elasticomyces elasticus]|nr:hypothetical protein LTR27_005630 [Elasticomyces elasticus]
MAAFMLQVETPFANARARDKVEEAILDRSGLLGIEGTVSREHQRCTASWSESRVMAHSLAELYQAASDEMWMSFGNPNPAKPTHNPISSTTVPIASPVHCKEPHNRRVGVVRERQARGKYERQPPNGEGYGLLLYAPTLNLSLDNLGHLRLAIPIRRAVAVGVAAVRGLNRTANGGDVVIAPIRRAVHVRDATKSLHLYAQPLQALIRSTSLPDPTADCGDVVVATTQLAIGVRTKTRCGRASPDVSLLLTAVVPATRLFMPLLRFAPASYCL